MTPNSFLTNQDQVNMRKNSCLTNDQIIFVLSENDPEKVENHVFHLNISTESNKERDEARFQVRLQGPKSKKDG